MAKRRSRNRNRNHDDASSKKRINTCDEGDVARWLDLNHDVLFLVMMQLGVIDFLSFSGVCKSWRSFALFNWKRFMASRPPMSMSTSTSTDVNEKEERYLYLEDFAGRKFKTILPRLVGRDFVGLTCGYLAFYGRETRDFWLVNPITRHQLHFPDAPFDFNASDWIEDRLILVFSPSIPGWVLAVANRSVDHKIWSSIAGEGAWNHVFFPFLILDFHAFKGKIYTLNYSEKKRDKFQLCEMRLNPHPKLTLLETKNFPDSNDLPLFVSLGENLYMRHYISEDWCDFYELDFGEMKWVSLEKTRQEYAFFYSWKHILQKCKCAFKPESWTGPWLKYAGYDVTKNSRQYGFYYANVWYFPHDCLNANGQHE